MPSALAETIRTAAQAKSTWLGKGAWALADQILISGTNFVTMVLLARGLSSTAAFGAFVLVYTILLFANCIQSALVTQPHNVLGVTRQGMEYVRYTSSAAFHQFMIILVAGLLALLAWVIGRTVGWSESTLLLALVPAVIGWQLQEFMRRVLYTERRIATAFAVDLLSYGGQLLMISVLWWQGRLSGALALYVIGMSAAAGALFGAWQIRDSLRGRWEYHAAIENWHYGKWLAGGEIIGNWASGQILIYMAAALLGAWAVGVLRAIHTIFGPMRIMAQAFSTTIPTRFARTLANHGQQAFRREVRLAFLIVTPVLGAYCLLIALLSGVILTFAFGEKYSGNEQVLKLYSISAFLGFLTMLLTATLRSTRRTKQIFHCNLLVTLTVVPLSGFLIPLCGIYGVVAGMILTNLLLAYLYYRTYTKTLLESAAVVSQHADQHEKDAEPVTSEPSLNRQVFHAPGAIIRSSNGGPTIDSQPVLNALSPGKN